MSDRCSAMLYEMPLGSWHATWIGVRFRCLFNRGHSSPHRWWSDDALLVVEWIGKGPRRTARGPTVSERTREEQPPMSEANIRKIAEKFRRDMRKAGLGVKIKAGDGEWFTIVEAPKKPAPAAREEQP